MTGRLPALLVYSHVKQLNITKGSHEPTLAAFPNAPGSVRKGRLARNIIIIIRKGLPGKKLSKLEKGWREKIELEKGPPGKKY